MKEKIDITKKNTNKKNSKKPVHNPQKVVSILKLFTNNNSHVKWSTHIWDDLSKFNTITDFYKTLKDDFSKFHELQYLNSDLYWQKIYPFIFQNKLLSIFPVQTKIHIHQL